MIKKLIIGSLLFAGIFVFAGGAFGHNEEKPHQHFSSFRGNSEYISQESGLKSDFWDTRDELREIHRQERFEARMKRMEEAGCYNAEEIAERLQLRRNRFSK